MTPDALATLLARGRYRIPNEEALQEGVEQHLLDNAVKFEREKRLSAHDRVDFLVDGGIAIELKLKGGRRAIFRQLERYAQHDAVTGIILMGNVAMGLPPTIVDKPALVVFLGRQAF